MVKFYDNILDQKNEDLNQTCINLDKAFFIKPTQNIKLRLQKSASDNIHKKAPNIPRLPLGKIEDKFTVKRESGRS